MSRLAGKAAIVTGGAVGIGAAICELFAKEGASVAVLDRNGDDARSTAERLAPTGARVVAMEADVTAYESIRAATDEIEAEFGGLDILINNAGVIGRGTVETTDEAEWNRVIGVNLTGVYLASRAAVPALRRRGGGSIVNVSSAAGLAAWYDQAAYDASKGGCVNLTRSMALDLARDGIRVNCLVPAHVVTPMSTNFSRSLGSAQNPGTDDHLATIPLGRYARPEEIAFGALFLASNEASYATGSMLVLDGGYLAR